MSTRLNRSLDKIFNETLGKNLGKTYRPTTPLGSSFGVNEDVHRRGSALRNAMDINLNNLRDVVSSVAAQRNNTIRQQDPLPEPTLNEFLLNGEKAPSNLNLLETPGEIQEFLEKTGFGLGPLAPRVRQAGGGLVGDVLGFVGDAISRPLYAVNESARNTLEALDEGQNPWETLDDIATGLKAGFMGERKTTPGQLAEYATNPDVERNRTAAGQLASFVVNPFSYIHEPTRMMREDNPDSSVARQSNRLTGFLGETVLDPVNAIGGKAVAQAGKKTATRENLQEILPDFAEKALKSEKTPDRIKLHEVAVRDKGVPSSTTRNVAQEHGAKLADSLERAALNPGDSIQAIQHQSVIDTVRQELIQSTLDEINKTFKVQYQRLANGEFKIGSGKYKKLVAKSDQWAALDRVLKNRLNTSDLNGFKLPDDIVEAAYNAALDVPLSDTLKYADEFEAIMRANMYNTFALRVGNTTLPIRSIGKANKIVRDNVPFLKTPEAISINRQMPGASGLASGRARRIGHQYFEQSSKDVRPIARQFSKEERVTLGRLRHEHGRNIPDHLPEKMKLGLQTLIGQYDDIVRRERAMGVMNVSEQTVDNYQYLVSRRHVSGFKKNQDALKKAKQARRKEVLTTVDGRHVTSPWAKTDKFKPAIKDVIDDPFEALAHRRLKSERLVSRANVVESFFHHYGFVGKLSDDAMQQRGLVEIYNPTKKNRTGRWKINENLAAKAHQNNESLYLPESVAKIYQNYLDIASFNSTEELRQFLLAYDKILNFFKISATVPYPGFHVKNMIGDIFLGYFDGIRANDYVQYQAQRKANKFKFHGHEDLDVVEFDDLFGREAGGSGFRENEYHPVLSEGGPDFKGKVRQAKEGLLDLSEKREDYARKVHLHAAINDELKRGKSWETAVQNASHRVNKWKFDYGALTATEKKYFRRIIPFYTFMRKSAPAMIEGLITHPSIYGKTHRFFDSDESKALAPRWIREIGFATPFSGTGIPFVGGEEEPLAIPKSVIPLDTFYNIFGSSELGDLSGIPENSLESMWSSTSPAIKSAVELPLNRNIFTGGEVLDKEAGNRATQRADYLLRNFVPPYATGKRTVENGKEGFDPGEFLFGSRFAAGVGGRRLDFEGQLKALRSDVGQVKTELRKISRSIEPYGIRIFVSESPQTTVKVRTLDTKKDLYVGNLQGAMNFVDQWTADPKNRISEGQEIVRYESNDGTYKTGPRNSPDLVRVID